MPDRDGIGGPFRPWRDAGQWHCHYCSTWLHTPREVAEHREQCGPLWQAELAEQQSRRRKADAAAE